MAERKIDMKKQSEWSNAYAKKAYDRINAFAPKGEREIWKKYAAEHGMTMNSLINMAVNEYMRKEDAKDGVC